MSKRDEDRWEHGSEFDWRSDLSQSPALAPWQPETEAQRFRGYGCGRDALTSLLQHGRTTRGWRRLWVPDYLCQEVTSTLASAIGETVLYADVPITPVPAIEGLPFRDGDVIFAVNHFGLRQPPDYSTARRVGIEVIEDHTHAPWSSWAFQSVADFCIASLRKTVPIPDGAVVWSPLTHPLPDQPRLTQARERAAHRKVAAMLLKARYLSGASIEKEAFRSLYLAGEREIASGEVSGMTQLSRALLPTFPIEVWREARRVNFAAFATTLESVPGLSVLPPTSEEMAPFSGILLFDAPEVRDLVRAHLIALRVYPATLWPLDSPVLPGTSAAATSFAQSMLSLHCDMRYGIADMQRVGELVVHAHTQAQRKH